MVFLESWARQSFCFFQVMESTGMWLSLAHYWNMTSSLVVWVSTMTLTSLPPGQRMLKRQRFWSTPSCWNLTSQSYSYYSTREFISNLRIKYKPTTLSHKDYSARRNSLKSNREKTIMQGNEYKRNDQQKAQLKLLVYLMQEDLVQALLSHHFQDYLIDIFYHSNLMSSNNSNNIPQNQQAIIFGQYSLRVLTLEHAEPVLQLLSRQFEDHQPLCCAFNKVVPVKDKEERLREWVKFYKLYEKYYLTNGLSIGAFDTSNNEELVGVIITKDLTYDSQDLQELYMKDVNFMSVYYKVERQLKTRVKEPYRSIINEKQPGVVLDFYSVAVKKEHSGRHLILEIGKFIQRLAKMKKYQYFYSFVTNIRSSIVFKNTGFKAIASLDAKQFKIEGVKYFENIEEENRNITLFLRLTLIERASL